MMAKFSCEPTPRPPETTIFAEVSSGRSEAAPLSSTQAERPGSAAARRGLDRARGLLAGRREAGAAHGDHLLGVAALHGLDRVAGIDRPLEGVGADHAGDVRDHHHVEQRRHPGRDVLAAGGGGEDDVLVGPGEARGPARPAARRAGGRRRHPRRGSPWRRPRAWRPPRPPRRRSRPRPACGSRRPCALAAVTVLAVASFRCALSCLATIRTDIRAPPLRSSASRPARRPRRP